MGKYVWYSGAADYPLEKRKRIKENILKMLDAGGMMQIESIKNNNHELYVLSKPEKDQNNRILWNYNYFEDDMWETASLDCKDLQIYSNKVGNEEYKDVMIALYMLSELEDNDIGFTMCNGDIVSEEKYVGWINQILGTNYSFRKRFNLWENVEWYIENEKCEEMHISMKELFELIPKNLRYAAGGTELADLLWVINGTSSLLPRDLDPDSYAYEVWKCQRAIQEIFIKDLENEEEKIKYQKWEKIINVMAVVGLLILGIFITVPCCLDIPYLLSNNLVEVTGEVTQGAMSGENSNSERRIHIRDEKTGEEHSLKYWGTGSDLGDKITVRYLPHTEYGYVVE